MDNGAGTANKRSIDPRVLVIGLAVLLILVVALASNLNLDGLRNDPPQLADELDFPQDPDGQSPEGSVGRDFELGPDGELSLGSGELGDVKIVQNADGSLVISGSNGGEVALVQDPNGTIAGLVVDADGNVTTLEVGETPPPGTTVLRPQGDGTTAVERDGQLLGTIGNPDGEGSWEIFLTPGGGIGVREADGSITVEGLAPEDLDLGGQLQPDPSSPDQDTNDDEDGDGGNTLLIMGLILLGLLVVALAMWAFRYWQQNKEAQPEPEPEPVDAAVQDAMTVVLSLLDQVRAEPDPRLAIQRAYAAAESAFGRPELARRPSETPTEFLERTVGSVNGLHEPLSRIVGLFEVARFSPHPVTEAMRDDAIDALVDMRDTLEQSVAVPVA